MGGVNEVDMRPRHVWRLLTVRGIPGYGTLRESILAGPDNWPCP